MEAEFVSLEKAAEEAEWLKSFLEGLCKNIQEMAKTEQDQTQEFIDCSKAVSNDIFCVFKSQVKPKAKNCKVQGLILPIAKRLWIAAKAISVLIEVILQGMLHPKDYKEPLKWVRLPSICGFIRSDGYAYPVFVRSLDRMGTPTQYYHYWSGWIRLPKFVCGLALILVLKLVFPLGGGTGGRVGRGGGRGKRPREGKDEPVDELNGQGNDQGIGANGGIDGVNGNVDGSNRGAPDFSTIIAQQLQDLLPAMLAQVGNQGNVGNQNGNVVNENIQENDRNVLVNGNRVCCSYKEFLACNPKKYDGKGGVVVLTRWIKKMKNVQDMSGCSIDQKVKYTAGSFVGKALRWWNSQIHMLSQEVAVGLSWNDFKFMMIEEFCPSHKMQKLETELWN
nr:reverse transcriptase domain-containing protein [Tanacetum cinerariifolium]